MQHPDNSESLNTSQIYKVPYQISVSVVVRMDGLFMLRQEIN